MAARVNSNGCGVAGFGFGGVGCAGAGTAAAALGGATGATGVASFALRIDRDHIATRHLVASSIGDVDSNGIAAGESGVRLIDDELAFGLAGVALGSRIGRREIGFAASAIDGVFSVLRRLHRGDGRKTGRRAIDIDFIEEGQLSLLPRGSRHLKFGDRLRFWRRRRCRADRGRESISAVDIRPDPVHVDGDLRLGFGRTDLPRHARDQFTVNFEGPTFQPISRPIGE
jgi:hypothetical protein